MASNVSDNKIGGGAAAPQLDSIGEEELISLSSKFFKREKKDFYFIPKTVRIDEESNTTQFLLKKDDLCFFCWQFKPTKPCKYCMEKYRSRNKNSRKFVNDSKISSYECKKCKSFQGFQYRDDETLEIFNSYDEGESLCKTCINRRETITNGNEKISIDIKPPSKTGEYYLCKPIMDFKKYDKPIKKCNPYKQLKTRPGPNFFEYVIFFIVEEKEVSLRFFSLTKMYGEDVKNALEFFNKDEALNSYGIQLVMTDKCGFESRPFSDYETNLYGSREYFLINFLTERYKSLEIKRFDILGIEVKKKKIAEQEEIIAEQKKKIAEKEEIIVNLNSYIQKKLDENEELKRRLDSVHTEIFRVSMLPSNQNASIINTFDKSILEQATGICSTLNLCEAETSSKTTYSFSSSSCMC